MQSRKQRTSLTAVRRLRLLLAALALAAALPAQASEESLRAFHAAAAAKLDRNAFGKPLILQSTESGDEVKGEIYARVDHPFAAVSGALRDADNWCEALLLPFNVKFCSAARDRLTLAVGRKFDQPLEDAYRLEFSYAAPPPGDRYFEVRLSAPKGPAGTHHYRIWLEALSVSGNQTFLHLSYAYRYGWSSRLMTQAYFATSGRNKVGFSTDEEDADRLVGGMRGALERNAMRYYLAIESHVWAATLPRATRFDQSLLRWFAATERYPQQLHEMERDEYLAMKRREFERQQQASG